MGGMTALFKMSFGRFCIEEVEAFFIPKVEHLSILMINVVFSLGSGKTAAFLLPIMNRIMQEGPYGPNYGVSRVHHVMMCFS